MSACRDFRDLLSAHLDGALDPAEAAALEAHLASCGDCARALGELRETVARIRSIEPVEPPPGFAEGVLARVAPRRRPLATRPWVQAAALVLICFSGYVVMRVAAPARGIVPPAVPEVPAPREAAPEPARKERAAPAPRREPAEKKEAPPAPPPAPVPPPAAVASGAAAQDRMENRALKAAARSAVAESFAAARVAFTLEAPEARTAALEALRRCGASLLPPGERSVSARMDSRRLPELRALLEKAGKVGGELPAQPPPEVVVTISW